jgi:hypothetical protein
MRSEMHHGALRIPQIGAIMGKGPEDHVQVRLPHPTKAGQAAQVDSRDTKSTHKSVI